VGFGVGAGVAGKFLAHGRVLDEVLCRIAPGLQVAGGDDESGGAAGDQAGSLVFRREGKEQRTLGAKIGEHLGGDGEDASFGFEDGNKDIGGGEDVLKLMVGLVGEQTQVLQVVEVLLLFEPVGAGAFRDDNDPDCGTLAEVQGEIEEQGRVMLETESAGVEEDKAICQAMLARPGVALGLRIKLIENCPIGDDGDAIGRYTPLVLQEEAKIVGDGYDVIAAGNQAALQSLVIAANASTQKGGFFAKQSMGRQADEILKPEDEVGANLPGGDQGAALSFQGRIGGNDDLRAVGEYALGEQGAIFPLLLPPFEVGIFLQGLADIEGGNAVAGRIGRRGLQFAARVVVIAGVEVQHLAAATGKGFAELDREGVAGVVVEQQAH